VEVDIYAEMFAWILATQQLQLSLHLQQSLVVSTTLSKEREGWKFVDRLGATQNKEIVSTVDRIGKPKQDFDATTNISSDDLCPSSTSDMALPTILHYCQRYMLGNFFFSKYRVKKNILDCTTPLFQAPVSAKDFVVDASFFNVVPPPANAKQTIKVEPRQPVTPSLALREAFVLCHVLRLFNDMLRVYKQGVCANPNFNTTWDIYKDPTYS